MVLFNLIPWFTSWSGNRKSIAERYGVFLLILKIVTAISCETCVSHINRGEQPLETYFHISIVLLQLPMKLFAHCFAAFELNMFAIRVRLSLFFRRCNWNLKELPSLGFVRALNVSRIHATILQQSFMYLRIRKWEFKHTTFDIWLAGFQVRVSVYNRDGCQNTSPKSIWTLQA